jgi:hypothetical protein
VRCRRSGNTLRQQASSLACAGPSAAFVPAVADGVNRPVAPPDGSASGALSRPLPYPRMANHVLEILDGDRAGEVIPVGDRALRIGRKPGNDIVLADEKTSGVHAEVVLEGDRHVLRDLASTNGTFLDGKRVNEIVLTPGDVVTIGRIRVRFRDAAEPAATDAGELAVRRLDASRLRGRSGSLGALAVVLVLALGGGAWFWLQQRDGGGNAGGTAAGKKAPVDVPGNKLASALASCDAEEGWNLRVAGTAFQGGASPHSGSGAFAATRGSGADEPDFAVLRLQDAVTVFANRPLTLAAYVRTADGGQVALRARLTSSNEQVPFTFCTGTAMASHDGWTRLETTVVVPTGCDRVQAEIAAVLPGANATVSVDDVAIVEGGTATPLEAKVEEGATALGTGASLAVRSVDTENPALLLQLLPDTVPPALQGLHRAELCTLSDLGATVTCTAGERGFRVECRGVDAVQWSFPADASGGLRVAGADGVFASASADSEFAAQSVLVGEAKTRAMLRFEQAAACRGRTAGGRYRLAVQAPAADLVLVFREEKLKANELLREARSARDGGRPGDALDKLRELAQKWPMDTEKLAEATVLRGELLAAQAAAVEGLQKDLNEASFFTTRGGFERVATGVDALEQTWGERNLADAAAAKALRDAARERLARIDGQSQDEQRKRLSDLERTFRESNQEGLARLVQRYREQYLPGAVRDAGSSSGGGGETAPKRGN